MRHFVRVGFLALFVAAVAVAGDRSKISWELRSTVGTLSNEPVQVVVQTTDVAIARRVITAAGGTVEMDATGLVLARASMASLERIAESPVVNVIRKPRAPEPFQTTSEGFNAIGAAAWHAAGRKGLGIKIAVLDVGFLGYSTQAGIELPPLQALHVRSFRSDGDITGGSEEHGTGVAEIVYDIAPQAELYLVNFGNEVELEKAVNWLIEQHVNIINTSWGYPCGGPVDGTGSMNTLVQRAADAGILWVAAAGNYARRHWSGKFNDTDADGWHNYSGDDEGNSVHMNAGDELRVCVEWDDWSKKDQNLDLYVYDSDGYRVASSQENQSGASTHDPWERVTFTANYTGDYVIGVWRVSGTKAVRMHMYAYEPGSECAMEKAAAAEPSGTLGVLDELRQFRDRILSATPFGQAVRRTYYRHSPEVARALLLHPSLALDAASLLKESRPALESVLDARAAPFVITDDYAQRVEAFLDALSAVASPALRADLGDFRAKAAFSAAVGQSADQYWKWLLMQTPPARVSTTAASYPDPGYMQYASTQTSLVPPADSAGAYTVGAFDVSNNTLEEFSSHGPTADGRQKPDISGPDGVCTATYADCSGDGFRGTSAAAPHVAAAAALVMQAYPTRGLGEVRAFLNGRAADMLTSGPDNQSGAGRLQLGTTADLDLFPEPVITAPAGGINVAWPSFAWSAVDGAASYRIMVAASASALPSDPNAQSCAQCLINTTTTPPSFIHDAAFNANKTYSWQVQARANGRNGLWAKASFTTPRNPEETEPSRTSLPEETGAWSSSAGKAVVITHGWKSDATSWVKEMADKVCAKLGNTRVVNSVKKNTLSKDCQTGGWDVWVLDWSAEVGLWSGPWGAYMGAVKIGEMLADNLEQKKYSHVHFIAHSAGSNLIHTATESLHQWMDDGNGPALTMHTTFLDAYEPSHYASYYGRFADWSDNYVDTRDVSIDSADGTRLFLTSSFNVDVTPVGDPCNFAEAWICRHSRPYRFYGESINTSFVGDAGYAAQDPVNATADVGFPLSLEAGQSLAALKSNRRKNTTCAIYGNQCIAATVSGEESHFSVISAPPSVDKTSGPVTYSKGSTSTFNSIGLNFVPQSNGPEVLATTPPAYLVANVTTTEAANQLRFRWRFNRAGEAYLRVYVDGILVRELDQRHMSSLTGAEEIYAGGPMGALPPGTHRLVIRLDNFGGNSGVELTKVEFGSMDAGSSKRRAIRH